MERTRIVNDCRCFLCREKKAVGIEFWTTTTAGEDAILCEDCLAEGVALIGYTHEPELTAEAERLREHAATQGAELVTLRKMRESVAGALAVAGGHAATGADEPRQARAGRAAAAKRAAPEQAAIS